MTDALICRLLERRGDEQHSVVGGQERTYLAFVSDQVVPERIVGERVHLVDHAILREQLNAVIRDIDSEMLTGDGQSL